MNRTLDRDPSLRDERSPLGSDGVTGAGLPPRPANWGREDRKRLFVWFGIGFILPGILVFAFRLQGKPSDIVFSVRSELPVKAILAFGVFVGTWIVARMEKRPLDDYGMPLRRAFGLRFWEGLIWGFAMLSAILLIIRASGDFQIDSVALRGAAAWRYALAWGLVFYCVAIHEEFAFRGYLLFSFARRLKFWRAAILSSAIFAVAHLGNPGENFLGILQVFVTGMIFCLTIRRTGTLWFAVGFHAAWDWAETFFYGTPDSGLLGVGRLLNTSVHGANWLTGGSAGPEGSVMAFLVLIVFAGIVHLRFPRAMYGMEK
ncbi:MAG TPA: type II CAAX endopeptidase family protein [Candidatus Acidoferrales bacterium]